MEATKQDLAASSFLKRRHRFITIHSLRNGPTHLRLTAFMAGLVIVLGLLIAPVRADTPDQIKNAEEWRKYHVPLGTPRCEGDILVELRGGIKMVVSREAYFKDSDGEDIKKDLRHPMYDCSITHLSGLSNVYANETDMHVPKEIDPKDEARKVATLEAARARGQTTKLPSGIEKISLPDRVLYILPLGKAPTADGQPVVFECLGRQEHPYTFDSCLVYYVLPNHIGIHYLIQWNHKDSNDYLRIDQQKRAFVDSVIAKAKQLTVPGEHK